MNYQKYRDELKKIMDENPEEYVPDEELERFTNYMRDLWAEDEITLYRYSPADYFNIRNFETGKLRLTNNGVLNDIFEGIPSDDCEEITPLMASGLSDLAYIKSFSEDPYDSLMWSHYADEHRGFCVEYNINLIEQDNFILNHLFPVVYSPKRRIKKNIAEVAQELKQLSRDREDNNEPDFNENLDDCMALFLSKGEMWAYEREWRIIFTQEQVYDIDDDELNRNIISFDYATGIYLGYRIERTIEENIFEIVQRINKKREESHLPYVKVYKMKMKPYSYELDFSDITDMLK